MMKNDNNEFGKEQYFVTHPKGNFLSGVMVFFGFSIASVLTIILIGFFALDIALHGVSLLLVPILILSAVITLLFFMGIKGQFMRARVKRFKKYQIILEGRELCSIDELAENIGESCELVCKDLKKMIESGWFIQGHIDTEEKNLFITDKMYEQYTLAMANLGVSLKKEIETKVADETEEV